MLVDHGFVVPMALMWRHLPQWPVKSVPFAVNTVQHPLTSARRCYALGKALLAPHGANWESAGRSLDRPIGKLRFA